VAKQSPKFMVTFCMQCMNYVNRIAVTSAHKLYRARAYTCRPMFHVFVSNCQQ